MFVPDLNQITPHVNVTLESNIVLDFPARMATFLAISAFTKSCMTSMPHVNNNAPDVSARLALTSHARRLIYSMRVNNGDRMTSTQGQKITRGRDVIPGVLVTSRDAYVISYVTLCTSKITRSLCQ